LGPVIGAGGRDEPLGAYRLKIADVEWHAQLKSLAERVSLILITPAASTGVRDFMSPHPKVHMHFTPTYSS